MHSVAAAAYHMGTHKQADCSLACHFLSKNISEWQVNSAPVIYTHLPRARPTATKYSLHSPMFHADTFVLESRLLRLSCEQP